VIKNHLFKTIGLTGLALITFAANSVLCRLALGSGSIDAASFSVIRLLSGAMILLIIIRITRKKNTSSVKGSWTAGFMLFLYIVTFSYAYISLGTGTGALILFGAVQITMILASIFAGARLHFTEWLGTIMAFTGFVYLILPGVSTPSTSGFLLMTIAGIAAAIITLKGFGSKDPLLDVAHSFFKAVPFIIVMGLVTLASAHYSSEGVILALLSGVITTGIGYAIWYLALGGLTSIQAAVLQLLVPLIAALGGVVFVSEAITSRLIISGALVLGGSMVVILGRYYFKRALTPRS